MQSGDTAEIHSLKIVSYMGFVMRSYGSFSVFLRTFQVDEAHIKSISRQQHSVLKWWRFCLELDDGWLSVGGQHKTEHFLVLKCLYLIHDKNISSQTTVLTFKILWPKNFGNMRLSWFGPAHFVLTNSCNDLADLNPAKLYKWPVELVLNVRKTDGSTAPVCLLVDFAVLKHCLHHDSVNQTNKFVTAYL